VTVLVASLFIEIVSWIGFTLISEHVRRLYTRGCHFS
jgi:hypothetical protein